MNETELQHKIDLVTKLNDNKQTIVTEKAGWYRVFYGSKTSFLRYKRSK
jgi:hypothetical protein